MKKRGNLLNRMMAAFLVVMMILSSQSMQYLTAQAEEGQTPGTEEQAPTPTPASNSTWSATVTWKDNSNQDGERPAVEDCSYTLKRCEQGQSVDKAETVAGSSVLVTTPEGSDSWTLTLVDAPACSESTDYVYFVTQTISGDAGSIYDTTYSNALDYVSEEEAIFDGGTIINCLADTEEINITVSWFDDKASDSSVRPDVYLYLHRVTEDQLSADAVSYAGIVQGYNKIEVSKDRDESTITFGDEEHPLDKYDANGSRYIYFVTASGAEEGYLSTADNSESDEKDTIKAYFSSDESSEATNICYVLDGGKLALTADEAVVVKASAELKMDAIKSFIDSNSYVGMLLQYKAADMEEWAYVTSEQKYLILSYESNTTIASNEVILHLRGFGPTKLSATDESVVCRKYYDNKEISYRWVEKNIYIKGSGLSVGTQVHNDHDDSVWYEVPGTILVSFGDGEVDVSFVVEQGENGVFVNTLSGYTVVEIAQTLTNRDGQNVSNDPDTMDGVYSMFKISRNDGKNTADGTLNDSEGEKVGPVYLNINDYNSEKDAWFRQITFPRFDENGAEYSYIVTMEEMFDPKGVTWNNKSEVSKDIGSLNWDKCDYSVPFLTATFNSSLENSGRQLIFQVEHRWLDGNDTLSRNPVTIDLIRIEDCETVGTYVLDESNDYKTTIYYTPEDTELKSADEFTTDDFVVLARQIGDVDVFMESFTSEDLENWHGGAMVFGKDNLGVAYGTIKREETEYSLVYYYNLYCGMKGYSLTEADVWLTAHAFANLTIELNNSILTGNDDKDGVSIGYRIRRTSVATVSQYVTAGGCSVSSTEGSTAFFENTILYLSGKKVKLEALPRFDAYGNPYTYEVECVALEVGGKQTSLTNGFGTIDGTKYLISIEENVENSEYAGSAQHYDGGSIVYESVLTKGDTVNVTVDVVWRDDGASKRPDVALKLYRVALSDSALIEAIKQLENGEKDITAIQTLLASKPASLVNSTVSWNQSVNPWLYEASYEKLPKYNPEGYEYLYYVVDSSIGGNYKCYPYDGTTVANHTKAGVTSPKNVLEATEDELLTDSKILVLREGPHTANAQETTYSGTLIYRKEASKSISGNVIWEAPESWTVGDGNRQEVTVQVYRTTNKDDYDAFLEGEGTSSAWEATHTLVLNATSAGEYHFARNSFTVQYDSDGKRLAAYDAYGMPYLYYVYEKEVTDTNGNGLGYVALGYDTDSVKYNQSNYRITNVYSYTQPAVKINGQVKWNVPTANLGESQVAVSELSPVTVTLWAQEVNASGEILTGAEPVKISDITLDPSDENVTMSADVKSGVLTYSFTEYTYDGDETKTSVIPYYGPNGRPLRYFVSESTVGLYYVAIWYYNGYCYNRDISQADSASTTATGHTIYLEKTQDNNYPYQNVSSIASAPASFKLDRDASFEITYGPGDTGFTANVKWEDGVVDNDAYRPDSIQLTIGRNYSSADGSLMTDENFSTTITIDKNDNSKTQTWTGSIENGLYQYAPNGSLYNYYIIDEKILVNGTATETASAVGDTFGNYTVTEITADTISLELTASTEISVEKQWKYEIEGDGSAININDFDTFVKFRSVNALPQRVQYVVQKRVNNGAWSYVDAIGEENDHVITITDASGATVKANALGYEVDIANLTEEQFTDLFNASVSWENLIKDDTIQYRVIERVIWKDNSTEANDLVENVASNNSDSRMSVTFSETTDHAVSITDTIKAKKVRIAQVWVDEKGQDNSRPSEITLTLTAKNTGNTTSYTLKTTGTEDIKKVGGKYYSYYYSDYFYLPAYYEFSGTYYNLTESTIDTGTYTPNVTFDNTLTDGAYTITLENTLNQDRKTVMVYVDKTWNGDRDYSTITRPYLKYSLQYLKQGGSASNDADWIALDDTTIKDFIEVPSTLTETERAAALAQTAYVIKAPNSTAEDPYKHSWNYLQKYWDNPTVDGVPEFIHYRVKEELVNAEGTAIATTSYTMDNEYVKPVDADYTETNNEIGGEFTNNLSRTKLYVQKKWTKNGTTSTLTRAQLDKLINLKAIPQTIEFVVEYSYDGTNWTTLPVKLSGRDTQGTFQVNVSDFINTSNKLVNQYSGFLLPKYNAAGVAIRYRVRENRVKYSGTTNWIDVSWDTGITKAISGSFETTPAAATEAANNTWLAEITNDYEYVDKTITKVWLDESNRDGVRTDFSVTLNRDGSWYGTVEQLSTGDSATVLGNNNVTVTKGQGNTWTVKYDLLPKYKAGSSAHTAGDESVYTWEESAIPASYMIYSYDNDGAERTKVTNIYEPQRGSVSTTKVWVDDTGWGNITQANEIYVKLQWSTDPANKNSWQDVTHNDLVEKQVTEGETTTTIKLYTSKFNSDGKDVTGENAYTTTTTQGTDANSVILKIVRNADGTYSTVTWENLPVKVNKDGNKNSNNTAKNVSYRVVEVDASGAVKSPTGYSYLKTTSENADLVNDATTIEKDTTKVTEVNNTLDYTQLNVKKSWTKNDSTEKFTEAEINKLIDINAIPEKVGVVIRYKIEGSTDHSDWAVIPNLIDDEGNVSTVSLNMADIITNNGKTIDIKLPKADKDGNVIIYQVYEQTVTYKNGITKDMNWDADIESGTGGSISTKPASAAASSTGTTNISLSNSYIPISKNITINFEDENNRDSKRSDVKITLYRNGEKYGEEISTADMTASSVDSQYCVVNKNVAGNKNQWIITVGNPAKDDENGDDYVYTWSVTNLPEGYTKDTSHTAPISFDTAETIAYQPIRGSITVTKHWDDDGNNFSTRPDDIYLKLQWSIDGTNWTDVDYKELKDVNGKLIYEAQGDTPYTTSDAGWLQLHVDPVSSSDQPSNTWKNLSKYVLVDTEQVEVQYRVIEGVEVEDENSDFIIVPVDANHPLKGYTVSGSTTVTIANTEADSTNDIVVTNTMDKGSVTFTNVVTVNGTAVTGDILDKLVQEYKVLPEELTIEIYFTNTSLRDDAAFPCGEKTMIYDSGTKSYREYDNAAETYIGNPNEVTFANLPVQDCDGNRFLFWASDSAEESVCEYGTSEKVQLTKGQTSNTTVTNNVTVGSLTVTNNWVDGNNRDDGRKETTVQLYLNGVAIGNSQTLNKENNWTFTWTELPIYKNGSKQTEATKNVYTVKELDANGTAISNNGSFVGANAVSYKVTYQNDVKLDRASATPAEFAITNTYTPLTISGMTTTINWNDDVTGRPSETSVKLQYSFDGSTWTDVEEAESFESADDISKVYIIGGNATQTAKATDSWQITWKDVTAFANNGSERTEVYFRAVTAVEGYQMTSEVVSYSSQEKAADITNYKTVLNLSIEGWTYGAAAKAPIADVNSGAQITIAYYLDEACTTETTAENSGAASNGGVPVNAGTYYVKASVPKTTAYAAAQKVAEFTIELICTSL